jgi:sulfotransferase
MKSYYFLAGLPRTGNTLLSSILNQNPTIYSSPLSPVSEMLWRHDQVTYGENSVRLNDKKGLENIGNNILDNYYSNIDKPVIIDREKSWGTVANFGFIKKYITPNPKIIFTTRPVTEILTSFLKILPTQSLALDADMIRNNWYVREYLTINDNYCDFLMQPWGQINSLLTSIDTIEKNKDNFCLIKYEEIINTPQEAMNKIYNFLELPIYEHDFNNITKLEVDNDEATGLPANLHEIRPQLKKISQDPKEVLSKYIIDKYSNIGWEGL